jgi:hypothetical protein
MSACGHHTSSSVSCRPRRRGTPNIPLSSMTCVVDSRHITTSTHPPTHAPSSSPPHTTFSPTPQPFGRKSIHKKAQPQAATSKCAARHPSRCPSRNSTRLLVRAVLTPPCLRCAQDAAAAAAAAYKGPPSSFTTNLHQTNKIGEMAMVPKDGHRASSSTFRLVVSNAQCGIVSRGAPPRHGNHDPPTYTTLMLQPWPAVALVVASSSPAVEQRRHVTAIQLANSCLPLSSSIGQHWPAVRAHARTPLVIPLPTVALARGWRV